MRFAIIVLALLPHLAQGGQNARFITEGRHYRVVQGDTLILPCKVANIGNLIRAWKRGIAILTAENIKLSPDERVSLLHNYDLEIRQVKPEDEGDYICQIASLQPQEITHTVEVLVPPHITEVSGGGLVEAKKGTLVTLECRAKGNPAPFYQWSRRVNTTLPGLKPMNGSTLSLGSVTRHQTGVYQCQANNGVGRPALREVSLKVLYAPEVEADEKWIHSGLNNQAVLTCTVYAEPPAEVRWYRSTLKLEVTDDHLTDIRGNRHRLVIRQVQPQDLDNYTCEAVNNLGRARQNVVLSGKPHEAIFKSPPLSNWRDSYNISWTVFSYTAVEEHKLFHRRKQFNGEVPNSLLKERWGNLTHWYHREWSDVSIPASSYGRNAHDITQEMSYMIRGLEPSTQYEAKVQARNRFGWNKMSDVFVFSTRGLEGYSWQEPSQDIFQSHDSDTEIRDMGVRAQANVLSVHRTSCVTLFLTLFAISYFFHW